VAQKLKALRHLHGALNLETIEAHPVFDGDELKDFEAEKRNRAKDIIEDFMIAANGVTTRYLASKKLPSLRRVVRTPKRWDRIIELASEWGFTLSKEPDAKTLEQFLVSGKAADSLRFPDLCLSVITLLGPVNTLSNFRKAVPPGTLVLRSWTILTPQFRTAGTPI